MKPGTAYQQGMLQGMLGRGGETGGACMLPGLAVVYARWNARTSVLSCCDACALCSAAPCERERERELQESLGSAAHPYACLAFAGACWQSRVRLGASGNKGRAIRLCCFLPSAMPPPGTRTSMRLSPCASWTAHPQVRVVGCLYDATQAFGMNQELCWGG
jgi:hypothetical protein